MKLAIIRAFTAAFFVIILSAGSVFADASLSQFSILDKFDEIWKNIQQQYVDPIPNTPEAKNECASKILGGGLSACLNDSHSSYLDKEGMVEFSISTSGEFSGVGLELMAQRNAAMIISPIDGTPAGNSGKFKAGDIIVEVDRERVDQKGLSYIVKKIRGVPNTSVTIRVRREGRMLEPVTLVRKNVQVQSVSSEIVEPGIAYVKLRQFSERTHREFHKAVIEQTRESAKTGLETRFVFDLRGNPGGLLAVVEMVGALFSDNPNDILVTVQSRSGDQVTNVSDLWFPSAGLFHRLKFVVLVDEGSASASEIFAGLMQDWGKAKVIGKTTVGKGSVQTIIPLSGGDGLRLTTYEYFVGNGRVKVNGVGVKPDFEIEDSRKPQSSVDEASAGVKPRLADPANDNQLKKGIEVLKSQ